MSRKYIFILSFIALTYVFFSDLAIFEYSLTIKINLLRISVRHKHFKVHFEISRTQSFSLKTLKYILQNNLYLTRILSSLWHKV